MSHGEVPGWNSGILEKHPQNSLLEGKSETICDYAKALYLGPEGRRRNSMVSVGALHVGEQVPTPSRARSHPKHGARRISL